MMAWSLDELAEELTAVSEGRSAFTDRERRDLGLPHEAQAWPTADVEQWLAEQPPSISEDWWSSETSRALTEQIVDRRVRRTGPRGGDPLQLAAIELRIDGDSAPRTVDLQLLLRCPQAQLDALRQTQPLLPAVLAGLSDWLENGAVLAGPSLLRAVGAGPWVEAWLSSLSEKQRFVIEARRATTEGRRTLLDIGKELGVSRERIRQIETKAVDTLTHARFTAALQAWEFIVAPWLWYELAGDRLALRHSTVEAWEKGSNPTPRRLILDLGCGGATEVLLRFGVRTGDIWYRSTTAKAMVEAASLQVDKQLTETPPPIPMGSFATWTGLRLDELAAALSVHGIAAIHDGYIVSANARLGGRRIRRVRAHRLLVEARSAVALTVLCRRYRQRHLDDPCSPRDLLIVIRPADHLFLQMTSGQWIAIGQEVIANPLLGAPVERGAVEPWTGKDDAGTLQHTIRSALLNSGGLATMGHLKRVLVDNPAVEMAEGSLAAVLSEREEFVRLAPGVFATSEFASTLDQIRAKTPLLMSKRHLMAFVVARAAGEPRNLYPMWTAAMERDWCHWAQESASPDIFRSLLAVCDPASWPVAESERRQWAQRKASEGDYRLYQPVRRPLEDSRVDAERFVATWLEIARIGRMNWVRTNRLALARVTDHHAAGTLALFVALGVLHPPHHWQMPHQARDLRFPSLCSLLAALHRQGTLSWKFGAGRDLLRTAVTRLDYGASGWVRPYRVRGLCERLVGEDLPIARDSADTSAAYLVRHEAEMMALAELFEE